MKLNNKGWGLSVFLTFIGIFLIAIILVAYLSNKYGYSGDECDESNPGCHIVDNEKNKNGL